MRKRLNLSILLAIIALMALLSLQYLWVKQNYKQENERIRLTALQLIRKEVHLEVNKSSGEYEFSPGYYRFYGGNPNDRSVYVVTQKDDIEIDRIERYCGTIEEWYEYMQNMYVLYHDNGIDMQRLDGEFTAALNNESITIPHKLELVDRFNNIIKESTGNSSIEEFKLTIDTIPLGIDDRDALVVKFDNSFSGMFLQVRSILYLSASIAIILAGILIFLVKTITLQERLSKTRDGYVSLMIHEIRNPVSYLAKIIELHKMGIDTKKLIPNATNSIVSLKLMLEKLQSVSSGRQLAIVPAEINIQEELDKIANLYSDENTSVEIESYMEDNKVIADKTHFINAIRNLVNNASIYRQNEKANIRILYGKENGKFILSVRDDGIGIPRIYQKLIFDNGYRIPEAKSTKNPGFGLGLTYVKMVATAHNGTVSVESRYKEGSTFTITIPVKQLPINESKLKK